MKKGSRLMSSVSDRCPTCGKPLPVDEDGNEEMVWILRGKFYCRENCARIAQGLGLPTVTRNRPRGAV